jgi:hypothetical protein
MIFPVVRITASTGTPRPDATIIESYRLHLPRSQSGSFNTSETAEPVSRR